MNRNNDARKGIQRLPAEVRFAEDLQRLASNDTHEVPPGWRLSPIAVERFIGGDAEHGIARKLPVIVDPDDLGRTENREVGERIEKGCDYWIGEKDRESQDPRHRE